MIKHLALLIFFLFINFSFSSAQTKGGKEVILKMLDACDKVRSAKFLLITNERLRNGKMSSAERRIKYIVEPRQIYMYSIVPNAGTSILWKKGWNENKMMVSPGSFPYITFSMKPTSSIAMTDVHHTLHDLGFEYVAGIVKYYLNTDPDKLYSLVKISDTLVWDNRSCIDISLDFSDFTFTNYTVKANENVYDIALKQHLNAYTILIDNPAIDDYDDVKAGQVIRLPNFYAKKIEFYVDRATWLPLVQIMNDQSGVYERYEMKSFILNPVFTPDDFSENNKEYKF